MTEAYEFAAPEPVSDPFAEQRAECRRQTSDAIEWLRGPVARRLTQPDAEARLRDVLPLAAVPIAEWLRFAQRGQAEPLDGELAVTCPCPCGHTFDVGLRGGAL